MSIEVANLFKTYESKKRPPVHALNGLDIRFPKGSMSAIMGPSGCGKSTLLNILAGIDLPTSGSVRVDGQDIAQCPDGVRSRFRNQKIGYVLQGFELIESMSVRENVALPLLFSTQSLRNKKQRVARCLGKVGLQGYEERPAAHLSGGQKQRVAIARALIMEPSILLADEPTGSLDSRTALEIMEVLSELNREGRTVVVVTHNPEVAKLCAARYTMLDGKIQV